MARIDLGLILPSTGTLIYDDGVSMNYQIPVNGVANNRQMVFSVFTDEKEEEKKTDGE